MHKILMSDNQEFPPPGIAAPPTKVPPPENPN